MALDAAWLGILMHDTYVDSIENAMQVRVSFRAAPALLVYAAMTIGVFFFAVIRDDIRTLGQSMRQGALFGAVTFAVFEGTNAAIFADWPLHLIAIDIVWGMILCSSMAAMSHMAYRMSDHR